MSNNFLRYPAVQKVCCCYYMLYWDHIWIMNQVCLYVKQVKAFGGLCNEQAADIRNLSVDRDLDKC